MKDSTSPLSAPRPSHIARTQARDVNTLSSRSTSQALAFADERWQITPTFGPNKKDASCAPCYIYTQHNTALHTDSSTPVATSPAAHCDRAVEVQVFLLSSLRSIAPPPPLYSGHVGTVGSETWCLIKRRVTVRRQPCWYTATRVHHTFTPTIPNHCSPC
jgi:hypothetical protein